MEDRLYLIGAFASMNKVSTRMLRHYDKINLLKPFLIKENGYRYYREQQIAVLSKIIMLRNCEFSLNEIALILKNDCNEFLMEQAKYKIDELNQQAKLHQKAIALLDGFRLEINRNDCVNLYGISLIECTENTLLVSKQFFDFEETENEFDKLFAFLKKKHWTPNGCAVLLSLFDESEEHKNQVGVPVTEPFQDEHYMTIVLPSSKRISTIHYGNYYNIGYAYSRIMNYAEQNGYPIEDCFTERYFIDSSHTASPNYYVTEISVSIKNNP